MHLCDLLVSKGSFLLVLVLKALAVLRLVDAMDTPAEGIFSAVIRRHPGKKSISNKEILVLILLLFDAWCGQELSAEFLVSNN